MNRPKKWMVMVVGLVAIMTSRTAVSQNFYRSSDSPVARMRPIGSASAVDRYKARPASSSAILRETGYQSSDSGLVRQTAMQFAFPGGPGSNVAPPVTSPAPNFNPPSGTTGTPPSAATVPAGPLSTQTLPQQPVPRLGNPPATLPFPGPARAAPLPPRSDYAPMNAPSLGGSGGSISNINNCANVTGPSGYSAAFSSPCGGCAPVGYQAPVPQGFQSPPTFQAPPAQIPAPAVLPGTSAIGPPAIGPSAALNPAPAGNLLSFGQEQFPVQVGQGLLGQPKAYVPGQTFRNWLRYFTP